MIKYFKYPQGERYKAEKAPSLLIGGDRHPVIWKKSRK
jgi:hypothetical protein